MGFIGAGISAAADLAMTAAEIYAAKKAATKQWERNKEGATTAFERSQLAAGEQRDFSERMSSTSYQRTMKDMQDAGLNPMLAYSQGGSNAAPGAAATATAATAAAAKIPSLQGIGTRAAGLYLQEKKQKEEIGLINQQEKTANAQEHLYQNQSYKTAQEDTILQMQKWKYHREREFWKNSPFAQASMNARILGETATTATGALNNFKPFTKNSKLIRTDRRDILGGSRTTHQYK